VTPGWWRHNGLAMGCPVPCGQRCVAAPGSAGVDVLALGGGVMEAKGGGLGGEFAECRNPSCAPREPELAELVEHGGVGERLPGVAAGEQPGAGGAARLSGLPEQESGEGLRDGRGRLAEVQEERAAETDGGQVQPGYVTAVMAQVKRPGGGRW
jgi:hypothetical protein